MSLTLDRLTLRPARFQRVGRRMICAWHVPRVGWRLYFDRAAQVRVAAYDREWSVLMPARGILTIRPTTEHLTPKVEHHYDFASGGGWGIDPYGEGTLLDHDRIMQRCAIGLYDVTTGKPKRVTPGKYDLTRFTQVHGYPMAAEPRPFDGQHLVRAYRAAVLHLRDPFVKMDLAALAYDAGIAWNAQFEADILKGPSGVGHGACGREWAWVAYLAALAGDRLLVQRMKRIAMHVAQWWGGLLRNKFGSYSGSPHPWGAVSAGGSGVPQSIDVAQDLECYHTILALETIGLPASAKLLARTVLASPLRKWIDCDTGLGVGVHHVALDQAWIGLGALARLDLGLAKEYAKAWPIPTALGSQVGPFPKLADTRKALEAWNEPGKSGAFLEATK